LAGPGLCEALYEMQIVVGVVGWSSSCASRSLGSTTNSTSQRHDRAHLAKSVPRVRRIMSVSCSPTVVSSTYIIAVCPVSSTLLLLPFVLPLVCPPSACSSRPSLSASSAFSYLSFCSPSPALHTKSLYSLPGPRTIYLGPSSGFLPTAHCSAELPLTPLQ